MSAASGIKGEEKPIIKPEPGKGDEATGGEEDLYEDTGECSIPPPGQETNAWLARLPKWLWEAWSTIAEDEEIELGKVRVYNTASNGKTKIRMILNDIPGHASVPKKYDIDMTKTDYNNTVIFSEKDQPNYSGSEGWSRSRAPRAKNQKRSKPPTYDNDKISKKPFRSSIPKQTALAGYLQHEVSVLAVENEEYHELSQRWLQGLQKSAKTTFNLGTGVGGATHPGTAFHPGVHTTAGGGFTSSAKQIKQKRQQEKAVRVSESELLDMLINCFKEYKYWSLRALKQRLKQPEVHIKTVIDKIASLVRSGPFAMNYQLKPEYADISASQEGAAEEGDTDDEMKLDEGEDDEGDFEDVKMEG